jgi:hypothetical protein
VPPSLIANVEKNSNSTQPQRLRWDFDIAAERNHAGGVTYHQVAQSIDWEAIQQKLPERERENFAKTLGDFIVYNRVNRIVREDFVTLADHIEQGRVQIVKSSFGPEDIKQIGDGKLQITLANGQEIKVDHLVNAAIGPVPALEQVQQSKLLGNLTKAGILTPHKTGTGFDVNSNDISLLGAQARPYSFSGLGIETYGRQITKQLLPHLIPKIDATLTTHPTIKFTPTRRLTHG